MLLWGSIGIVLMVFLEFHGILMRTFEGGS